MEEGEDSQANAANGGAEADQPITYPEETPVTTAAVSSERQPNKVRVTTPYLTKYERARILGTRALQIRSESFSSLSVPSV